MKNHFYISQIKIRDMEMYIIALVGYLVLFVISTLASRNFNGKTTAPISGQNTSIDSNLVKETVIVNPEIVGAK